MAATTRKESSVRRVEQLSAEIRRHNDLYYDQDAPVISDDQWDALFQELKRLENDWPELIRPDSPTQRVGAPPEAASLAKVRHQERMMSLDKALKPEEIAEFVNRTRRFLGDCSDLEFYVMPKFDGLAIELVYEEGRLILAATRGDGVIGENITANALTIPDIPSQLNQAAGNGPLDFSAPPPRLVVRGEVYMEKAEFLALNTRREEEGLAVFANPRNAAAGSLRQLDQAVTRARQLNFFAYGLANPAATGLTTYGQTMAALKSWGFPVESSRFTAGGRTLEQVLTIFDELEKAREELPYEIDGLVLTIEDLALWSRLGTTARAPRYALAAKFKPRLVETLVQEIEIQVGRTGVLTPVARLAPVPVGGVTVSNATLHNEDELRRKDVRPGDTVMVRRAGEVIPEVVEVVFSRRPSGLPPFDFPTFCPICRTPTVRREGEAARRCPNLWCPAQVRERFYHFVGKNALNINGLGDKIVETLLAGNLVKIPSDIYRLTLDDLIRLPRLGEKSAHNLLKAIEKTKTAPLWRFIHALGIRHVGERTSQILAERFLSLIDLRAAGEEELTGLNDIGPEVAASLREFFQNPLNQSFLEDLSDPTLGLQPTSEAGRGGDSASSGPLAGQKFVLTGTLSQFTRAEAKARLTALGGQVMSSLSRETDYLVAGQAAGHKLAKAASLGVTVLSEDDFLRLISGREPASVATGPDAGPGIKRENRLLFEI